MGDHHHHAAFQQRYEGENLDAATLLIPIIGFLPPDHPLHALAGMPASP